MLAGRLNKKTKSFSANHSYYDSSHIQEYFKSSESYRTYPYLKEFVNKITMYPVFSLSKLSINLEIYSKNKTFISPEINFSSKSSKPLNICINDYVNSNNLKDVSAFSLVAKEKNVNPVHACLDFAINNKNIDKLVVGFNSKNNFEDILKFKKTKLNFNSFKLKINQKLLDPRKW